jgi:hypothetical protein
MKKITSKVFILALFITCGISAQLKKKIGTSQNLRILQNINVNNFDQNSYLTDENQKSLDETGYVKCLSIEMNQRRLQREGNYLQNDAFEEWIAPKIEAHKQLVSQQKQNGTYRRTVTTIPIIFHVITDGVGQENLSASIIQAQIDQLNLDFSNQAGSTNPVAADALVQFIPAVVDPLGNILPEPGIDRVTSYGDGPFNRTDFDVGDGGLEIKSTVWDRNQYANIWTADIAGGILGYAQFPSNSTLPGFNVNGGTATNDGVVIGYGTVGSVNIPGSGAPYNLGRTLTHEIGHWIGLRHIWGDGGCGVDDFCNDTPDSDGPNYGVGGATSCGSTDQVENYMDYTDDSIMNIFTADQVSRIATVISVADGFVNLVNSTTGDPGSIISFLPNATLNFTEGSTCSFTDIVSSVNLAVASSQPTEVNFFVNGGTAQNNLDFDLLTNSVNYAVGETGTKNITVRVYNDSFVESDETIEINFTVNSNGGEASEGNNSIVLFISDDDIAPISTQVVSLLSSDFEDADTTNWNLIDADGIVANNWSGFMGLTYTGIDGDFFGSLSNNVLGNGANYSPDNYLLSDAIAIPANASNVNFTYGIGGYLDSEPFEVYWTTDNSSDMSILAGTLIDFGNSAEGTGEIRNINITNIAGQTGYLVFRHFSQGNGPARTNGILLLDNVDINVTIPAFVQTAVNVGTTNDELNLFGTGTAYTSDTVTGNLISDITNNNTFNYGCVSSSVFRAGFSAQSYNGSTSPNLAMDKVFNIVPSNTSSSGDTSIKFYFTEAEISGWEAATGETRSELVIYNDERDEIITPTLEAFGTDITLTGNFSGLNGNYYFGTSVTFEKATFSPKIYLQGAFTDANAGEETLMRDDLRIAGLLPSTSPYSDNLTCNISVFNISGNNAIVDWVWVELRDGSDNSNVLMSQSALLQRDGDVVSNDGVSPLVFPLTSGNYFISVNHRNHLGIMINSALNLTGTNSNIDLSTSNVSILGSSNAVVEINGVFALISGDFNGDGQIVNADVQSVIPLAGTSGYSTADADMNGQITNTDIQLLIISNAGKGQQY